MTFSNPPHELRRPSVGQNIVHVACVGSQFIMAGNSVFKPFSNQRYINKCQLRENAASVSN